MIAARMHDLFMWLADSRVGLAIRDSQLAVPVIVVFHLFGLVLLGGAAVIINLAVADLIIRQPSAVAVDRELWRFFVAGLSLSTLTGVLLVSSNADSYFFNPVFRLKLALLIPAALVSFILHRHLRRQGDNVINSIPWKITSALGLLLWVGVTVAGRVVGLF